MGGAWSMLEPEEMRLASRDVCDDETWANTVLNRSSTSVQQRLHMLSWEPSSTLPAFLTASVGNACSVTRQRLEFAREDMVRVFEKHVDEDILLADPDLFLCDQRFDSNCESESESDDSDSSLDDW